MGTVFEYKQLFLTGQLTFFVESVKIHDKSLVSIVAVGEKHFIP